jgi:hypothetical protein
MHDFTGTFKFNIQKPKFEKIPLLPQNAEILGSQENTIIYLQNPDPIGVWMDEKQDNYGGI